MELFGDKFSQTLYDGCLSRKWAPEWVLCVCALESDFNPLAQSQSGARGLFQRMPLQLCDATGIAEILPIGTEEAPPGCFIRAHLGPEHDLVGYTVWRYYPVVDPVHQLIDYLDWTDRQMTTFRTGPVRTRESLYCLNLAPARLLGGVYGPDTMLYSACTPQYRENARSFGCDPSANVGGLYMKNLATGLDAAMRRNLARYNAESLAVWMGHPKSSA